MSLSQLGQNNRVSDRSPNMVLSRVSGPYQQNSHHNIEHYCYSNMIDRKTEDSGAGHQECGSKAR